MTKINQNQNGITDILANQKLTQREKVIAIIDRTEDVIILFDNVNIGRRLAMCRKCKADMTNFDIVIDEHTEFECKYCDKNVKVPLYVFDEDVYTFPNEYYRDESPRHITAQSLAQAHRKHLLKLWGYLK